MKIIVVGCGKIGTKVLSSLVKEGHDVVAMDKDPEVIDEITNIYDAIGVCGNGADCETLEEAGIADTELFVAVTESDELNMLSCFLAKRMGAKYTIARIRNPEYNDASLGFMRHHLDLSMSLNPDIMVARRLFHVLRLPTAAKVETFAGGRFEIVEILLKQNTAVDGMSLIQLRKKYSEKFLVCAVQREDRVYVPDGNFVLHSGDRIALTASPSEIHKLLKHLGILKKQARNVMILGASRISFYLAKMLILSGNNVKIVDKNKQRCEEFAEKLPGADIIYGDGAKREVLLQEGLRSTDAFVALTGMDEENILISYYATSLNVPKVIAKINRDEFISMAEKLGVECLISPQRTVSDMIVRYARALKNSMDSSVEKLYKLMDDNAEALEFVAKADCELLNIPLKELELKRNVLVAGIVRGRKIVIPDGDDAIMEGDRVIILAAGRRVDNLSDIAE